MTHITASAAEELWQSARSQLESQIPPQSYSTWIQPLSVVKFEDNLLWLETPTRFHLEWIESHYLNGIQTHLKQQSGTDIRIKLVVARDKPLSVNGKVHDADEPIRGPELLPAKTDAAESRVQIHQPDSETHLNPRYTFEAFVEGDCNSFARAACLALGDFSRLCPWNPLLLYGGTGLGKTHLLQAIGNRIVQRNRGARVLYVTSERFTQEFIHAVRTSNVTDFTQRYRTIDLLLVDDVQFLATKERTQIEFFHVFNALYQAGKRIALTADRPLADLQGFDARLISRFDSGLATNLEPPDYETRVAILLNRAAMDSFPLSREIADAIATHITSNVRELEGVYVTLAARCQLLRMPATLELAREIIRNRTGQSAMRPPAEKILEVVSSHFGVSIDAIRGKSRKKELVFVRMLAMTLMTEMTNMPLKAIGATCGGRDHSTVIHARDTIRERRDAKDPQVMEALQLLVQKLSLFTLVSGSRAS